MPETLCQRFGLTEIKRAERLALLGLSERDHVAAKLLQEDIIGPKVSAIVDDFYTQLLFSPEAQQVVNNGFSVANLKKTQRKYLLTLGCDFASETYFEQRLQIGYRHVEVGVRPSLYQCAYHILQRLIISSITQRHPQRDLLTGFVAKILALDASLALQAYETAREETFHDSLVMLEQEQASLKEKVNTDSLTGLLSRQRILQILEERIAQHRDAVLSVIMVDLDHFKATNDTYGHLVGDDVLRVTAKRMHSMVRGLNWIGRYGGEEFLIILNNTNAQRAVNVAERIRKRIAAEPVRVKTLRIPITLSLGVAEVLPDEDGMAAIHRADKALYSSKMNGRNRVEVADSIVDEAPI